jgi:hypothetical protein
MFFNEVKKTRVYLRGYVPVLLICALFQTHAEGAITLTDVTRDTRIGFRHTDGGSGRYYIMETVSAGLALFDYDNDGDVDIYFINGAPLRGATFKVPPRNALYRNEGSWKFTDVTKESGLGDTGYGLGVTAGDYDNDGDQDIYLNNYGPNVLYRNNGDGTFTDVTESAGVGSGFQVGAGTCFLDIDKDGDLDLYAANYLEFSYEGHVTKTTQGIAVYANPRYYRPVHDNLFRNNSDGTFTDVSRESGIADHAGWGMGMVCGDYDDDGDTDIFIANDVAENFLFMNDGSGRFEEVALVSGAAYDLSGNSQGSMGVDCGDYDNDGLLDFYMTSFQEQFTALYHNAGKGIFQEVHLITGAGTGTHPYVTWGNSFVDFDNDGDRDIFVACGHLQVNIELIDDTSAYHVKNILLMNNGDGKFVNVSEESGDGMRIKLSSRGAGFDDLDNDGDVDVVVMNSRREPTILRNDSPSKGHWLQVRLRGIKSNRDGVGARVTVAAGDLKLVDEVHSGRGYQSHYGTRLHFGLGQRKHIESIEVRWIGGGTDIFRGIAADQEVELVEGKGS